jgi:hypothetical protein
MTLRLEFQIRSSNSQFGATLDMGLKRGVGFAPSGGA